MPVFTEGRHPLEGLISEAEGQRSRENIIIAAGSGVIAAMTVLGKLTATGKYVPSPATGADGSQTAAAISLYGCDATSADVAIAAINTDAVVAWAALTYAPTVNDPTKTTAKNAQLAAIGIKVR